MASSRHVGIRDVARAAGVSITTVSHALNDKPGVSDATRRNVRAVAEELGYRPDPRGRQLASGRSGLVALTVSLPGGIRAPVAAYAHNAAIIDGAAVATTGRELALVIVPPGGGVIWQRLPVEGAILVDPSPGDPAIDELARVGVPVVTIGRITDPGAAITPACVVDNDYAEGTRSMLEHLADRGAERVGLVRAGGLESYAEDSAAAYERWCANRGQEPWTFRLDGPDWSDLDLAVAEATAELLDAPDVPDAIHCLDEVMAVALLAECRARSISVPAQLMVSSISDRGWADRTIPTLTTLELNPRDLGEAAGGALADLIDGRTVPAGAVIVPATVVARDSTARDPA
jgi:DNA-binding LacI/PurR family transcriptional regulator